MSIITEMSTEVLENTIQKHQEKINELKRMDTSDANQAQAVYGAVDFHEHKIKQLESELESRGKLR